jgi:hypothetical protein
MVYLLNVMSHTVGTDSVLLYVPGKVCREAMRRVWATTNVSLCIARFLFQ